MYVTEFLIYMHDRIVLHSTESCDQYGVVTVSRIDTMIGLFGRISSLLLGSFAKETYNVIDPTNRSHPILNHVTSRSRSGGLIPKYDMVT